MKFDRYGSHDQLIRKFICGKFCHPTLVVFQASDWTLHRQSSIGLINYVAHMWLQHNRFIAKAHVVAQLYSKCPYGAERNCLNIDRNS